MRKSLLFALPFAFLACAGNSGCEPSSDSIQRDQQEAILLQGTQSIGMPSILNFQERRTLKMILELRDKKVPTITYTENLQGVRNLLCRHSIGYGIGAAVQYTNPMKQVYQGVTLPQADPNGLYSPSSSEATYIMCLNGRTKELDVLYSEPRIIVSPSPLEDYLIEPEKK